MSDYSVTISKASLQSLISALSYPALKTFIKQLIAYYKFYAKQRHLEAINERIHCIVNHKL